MRKKLPGLVAGTIAALMIPHVASAQMQVVLEHDPSNNDEARTRVRDGREVLRAHDQHGAGSEMANYAFHGDKGMIIATSSGRLLNGETPQNSEVQCSATPVTLVPNAETQAGVSLEIGESTYVTSHAGDEHRTCMHAEISPVSEGIYVMQFNWQENGRNQNTERRLMVINQQGERLQLTGNVELLQNNTIATIMAKNNDDCAGTQSGGGCDEFVHPDGTVTFSCGQLCNGNGRDDGWNNVFELSCDEAAGVCDVQKKFDTSIIEREERSRPMCQIVDGDGDGTPDASVCCGTEGNSQPQREGVWCSAVNLTSGEREWRQRMAYRGENSEGQRTYAMRAKLLRPGTVTDLGTDSMDNLSNDFYLQYQMRYGNNAGNRPGNKKGGADFGVNLQRFRYTPQGPEVIGEYDLTQAVINSGVEMTHVAPFISLDAEAKPVLSYLGTSFIAGTSGTEIFNVGLDANGLPYELPNKVLQASQDGQLYSNLYGNNPQNQGRNYTECGVIRNPFVDQAGPSRGIRFFNVCVLTGKLPGDPLTKKLSIMSEIWATESAAVDPEPEPEPTPDTPQNDPQDDPDSPDTPTPTPEPAPEDSATPPSQTGSLGGCSVPGSGANGGLAMLIGLALVVGRRRRRR